MGSNPVPSVHFSPPAVPNLEKITCADFMEFQDALKKNRIIDDKIIYELNTTIPTDSFARGVNVTERCSNLYKQLQSAYSIRDGAIRRCINETQKNLEGIRQRRENEPDNSDLLKSLRRCQTNLRLLQSEINVEEVVKDRSLKVFYERCRSAFKPPDSINY